MDYDIGIRLEQIINQQAETNEILKTLLIKSFPELVKEAKKQN